MERSHKSFSEALENLIQELDISKRWIAIRTQEHDFAATSPLPNRPKVSGRLSPTYLGEISKGLKPPRPEHMEAIAQVTGIEPEYFLEYRQHLAATAAAQNVDAIGLEKLLNHLNKLAGK